MPYEPSADLVTSISLSGSGYNMYSSPHPLVLFGTGMASEEGKPFVQADEAAPTLSMLLAASNLGENGGTLFVLLQICSLMHLYPSTYTSYQYVVSGNAGKGGKGAGAKGKPAEGADKAAKGGAAAGKKAGKEKPPVVSKPPPSVLAVSLILYRSHLLSGWGAHCALVWLYRETWPVLFLAALSDRSASTSRRPSTTPMAILTWGMPTR